MSIKALSRVTLPAIALAAMLFPGLSSSRLMAQAPNIGVTKSDGTPAATQKAPGSTVTYTNTITNTGTANATGVTFTDPDVNGSAVQMSTLKVSPLAFDDTYTQVVASGVTVDTNQASEFSVTANDYVGIYNNAAGVLTITAFDAVSVNGGAVTMVTTGADIGKFTYTSAAGYVGTDSFTYTISNTGFTSVGTVTLTVSGPKMFFVNATTGNDTTGKGTLALPYQTLTKVATVDSSSARVFIFAGAYTAGMTMEANEVLFGQGVVGANFDAVVLGVTPGSDSAARPNINGTLPTITVAGNVIVLANNNVIRGVALSCTGGAGYAVSGTAINDLQLGSSGGNTASDTTVSSSGAAAAGAVSLTGGGNGTVNILALVGNSGATGRSLTISGRTGGVTSVIGKVTDTGSGISLSSNTGATFNFRSFNLATGANTAFSATGGGTVNATAGESDGIDNNGDGTTDDALEANIINNTTGGTCVNIASTDIGASNFILRSLTSTGGTTPGINLNTTGSTGGLIVTGDSGGSNNASGGSITNKAGTALTTGTPGVVAISTAKLRLGYMNITGCNHSGIYGSTVNGFVLTRCNINTNGDQLVSNPDETGVDITNLVGTASAGSNPTTISNCVIQNNKEFELQITNTTGTLTDFQVNNCTISSNNADTLNPHGNLFNFTGSSTAVMTLNLVGSTFTGNAQSPGGTTATAVHCDIGGSGTMTANVSTCTITNNNVGVNVSASGAGTLTYDVHDNPTVTTNRSHGLNCFLASDATGLINGKFRNNVVGTLGTAGSGSDIGFGIRIQNEAASSANAANFLVSGNTVQETSNFNSFNVNTGLATIATTKTTNLTIQNNTFRNSNARAITIQQNNATNGTSAGIIHAHIASNTFSGIAGQAADGTEIRLRQLAGNGGTFRLNQTSDTNLATVNSLTLADLSIAGTITYNQGLPTAPPLMFAPGGVEKAEKPTLPVLASAASAATESNPVQPNPTKSNLENSAPVAPAAEIPLLAQADLNSLVAVARERWAASGLTADQQKLLNFLTFEVASLDGVRLGEAAGNVIRIDADGGTYGWYVGADDQAFESASSATRLYTSPAGAAAGRLDLLTTLMHEMGHTLGLEDSYLAADRESLMYGFLTKGERRLPAMNQAQGVVPHEHDHDTHFLTGSISIGVLPPNKSITITYDVIINNPATTNTLSSQASVSGGNFSAVLSDDLVSGGDPLLVGAADPTVTLIDLPDVTVAVAPSSVLEDGGTGMVYTFTRQGSTTATMSVSFSTAGSTATPGTDFLISSATASYSTGTGLGTILIPIGSSTATLTATPVTDTAFETNETVVVNVTTGTGYDVGTPGTASGTITNDDTEVSIDALPDTTLFEDQTVNFSYTFRRQGPTTSALTANFSVGGSATFGTDYTQSGATTFTTTSGSVTFGVGVSTVLVTLDPTADNAVEGNEAITLTVTSAAGYTVGSPAAQTATIIDDDVTVSVTSVVPASVNEDSGTGMVYTFTRSGGSTANALTVGIGISGTATYNVVPASSDYTQSGAATFTGSTGTITFAGGSATKTVTITPVADTTGESDETVILTVATNGTPAVTGGYTPAAAPNDSGTGTIVNDDTTVSVAVAPSAVGESSGTPLVYTFTRSGSTAAALPINFTKGGTASLAAPDFSVASSAAVFNYAAGTLTIPIGAASVTVSITPLGDSIVEANETVILSVAAGGGYVPAASPNDTATGTINDDDVATVSIAKIADGFEGPPIVNGKFRVTQTAISSTDTVINYSVTGTATPGAGNDYTTLSGTVTILAGNTTADIDVLVLADATAGEPTETVIVTFSTFGSHDADITFGSPTTATVNIISGPTPAATALGDVVTDNGAPGSDGATNIGNYDLLRRGAYLSQNGDLVFTGNLLVGSGSPAVTVNDFQGIWAKDATNPIRLIARSGSIAAGTGNALFDILPEVPSIEDQGDVTFLASLRIGTGSPAVTASNDTGLWTTIGVLGANPQPVLMAREGSALRPPSNTVITKFATGCYSTAGTGSGRIMSFSGTQADGKTGIYVMTMSTAGLPQAAVNTAVEGNAAPGAGGEVWDNLASGFSDPQRMDAPGNYCWGAKVKPSGREGVWYASLVNGTAIKVMIAGDAAPGTTTTFSAMYGDMPVMGGTSNIAFHAYLAATGDNASGQRGDGIWKGVGTSPTTDISTFALVARAGDTGVAGLPGGAKVGNLWSPWMSNGNRLAFRGWVDVDGNGVSGNGTDVYGQYADTNGTLTMVIKQGDNAPGMPAGATMFFMDLPVIGGQEQMAFLGTVTGGGTTAANNQGIWRQGANGGALALVARTGDSISTTQGTKVIAKLDFPGTSQNNGITDHRWEQSVMDSTGRMVIQATFTDGTTSVVFIP